MELHLLFPSFTCRPRPMPNWPLCKWAVFLLVDRFRTMSLHKSAAFNYYSNAGRSRGTSRSLNPELTRKQVQETFFGRQCSIIVIAWMWGTFSGDTALNVMLSRRRNVETSRGRIPQNTSIKGVRKRCFKAKDHSSFVLQNNTVSKDAKKVLVVTT